MVRRISGNKRGKVTEKSRKLTNYMEPSSF
jgi:hypothetical protein